MKVLHNVMLIGAFIFSYQASAMQPEHIIMLGVFANQIVHPNINNEDQNPDLYNQMPKYPRKKSPKHETKSRNQPHSARLRVFSQHHK